MATKGKIVYEIQRFSTLKDENRFSEIVKVGKNEWCLAAAIIMDSGKESLRLSLCCNNLIPESTWTGQVAMGFWLVKTETVKMWTGEATSLVFKANDYCCYYQNLIAKSLIPQGYVMDDILTIQAEFLVVKEECPSINFGFPNDVQVSSYEQVMQDQSHSNLFNSDIFSDVVFIVGPKVLEATNAVCIPVKIPGHRSVIAMSSSVFSSMLFPTEPLFLTSKHDEKGRLMIEIEDPKTHPTALLTVLRFIYKKEVVVDPDLIEETLYLAEKYNVKNFAESLGFLVTPQTVLGFLPFVLLVGKNHVLYDRCKWIIDSQTKSVINSNYFLEIQDEIVQFIFSSDLLQIRELDLFKSYVEWADYQCQRQGIAINDENKRRVMKHLNLIRFPIMTPEEFSSGPSMTNTLTGDETSSVFRYMLVKTPTIFSTQFRNF